MSDKPKKTGRRNERENIMKLLYMMDMRGDFNAELEEEYAENYAADNVKLSYVREVTEAFIQNKETIDSEIEKNANKWTIERMSKVDLAILRTAATEILYIEKIPGTVAVNEAIEIAKKYAVDDSGKFINGVLGNLLRSHEE